MGAPDDPLDALRRGRPDAFERFVEDSSRRLMGFFLRMGADLHRAEDLTQEVFLRLHRRAGRYRPEGRPEAFVLAVARNLWIDEGRRRSARLSEASGAPGRERREPGHGPLESAERGEDEARLRAGLAALPEHHRMVVELALFQGLSYGEVGALLEIPVGTVKSRMHHALRRLREVEEEA